MEYRHIRIEERERSVTLTLDRPPENLLHIDMMDEINQGLLGLRSRDYLEVLVIRGSSEIFSRGLDLADHGKNRLQRMLQVYSRIFETIRMIDLVSIAAVEGRAWGS